MRLKFASVVVVAIAVLGFGTASAFAQSGSGAAAAAKLKGKAKKRSFFVCKHGCRYRTIQSAVNASGRNAIINIKPGRYVEGVIVEGHRHDGLTIRGIGKSARSVILDGKNAKGPDGLAQNGIEGVNVNNLRMIKMWARNYATNGFFVHTDRVSTKKTDCRGFLMKNLIASFNRSYGMYAFRCIGGRITHAVGYGHGDSAFYIGATPPQRKPKWTSLDHLRGFENVLGFSGTNSRYINIHDNFFYNNGVGVVPNTLDSEPYEPAATGIIRNNKIFWNNFNYFLPNSRVATVSGGLGEFNGATIQYPTGVGIVLLGTDGWKVFNNDIFGNFKWGIAPVSNPLNEDGDNSGDGEAINLNNRIINNRMGKSGTDLNGTDFFTDGSGKGTCYMNNGVNSTYDPGDAPNSELYPQTCPTDIGPGGSSGDLSQFVQLVTYVTTTPPENQECSWTKHSHPPYKKFKALNLGGATCP